MYFPVEIGGPWVAFVNTQRYLEVSTPARVVSVTLLTMLVETMRTIFVVQRNIWNVFIQRFYWTITMNNIVFTINNIVFFQFMLQL